MPETASRQNCLTGLPASPGVAVGRAQVFRSKAITTSPASSGRADPAAENARLSSALTKVENDLRILRRQTCERLNEAKAEIFDVHISFLRDPELVGRAREAINTAALSAEKAISQASQAFIDLMEHSCDEMLISRAMDLKDVTRRILATLSGHPTESAPVFDIDTIAVITDPTPSDIVNLDLANVRGIVTSGSITSHVAILARAMRTPAVMGSQSLLDAIPDGTNVIIDGQTGGVNIAPSKEQLEHASLKQRERLAQWETAASNISIGPGKTADGRLLALLANIDHAEQIPEALSLGAEGIGLFRSEMQFLDRSSLPHENDLCRIYRHTLELMAPSPVVIRTLDIGGDKIVSTLATEGESNPFLGVRGLRLCLANEPLFRMQLRALLRASSHGLLKLMFPMVAVVEELRTAKRWLEEERTKLHAEGHPVADKIDVGIMIEVPAAALMAGTFAREVDFFSIGTNDLVQYAMAADRTNHNLAHLQSAFHPAVLRLIQITVQAAHSNGKRVSLCGEMGSDLLALPLLDGLELDSISMSVPALGNARTALARMRHTANLELAQRCLSLDSAEQVVHCIRDTCGNLLS